MSSSPSLIDLPCLETGTITAPFFSRIGLPLEKPHLFFPIAYLLPLAFLFLVNLMHPLRAFCLRQRSSASSLVTSLCFFLHHNFIIPPFRSCGCSFEPHLPSFQTAGSYGNRFPFWQDCRICNKTLLPFFGSRKHRSTCDCLFRGKPRR